jgi:membrane-associated phospholipid phosphatase
VRRPARREVAALLAALAVTLATMLLDPWAYRHAVWPPIYRHDWGNLLRVVGTVYFWLPVALAVWLEARARAPDRASRAWLLLVGPAVAGGLAEALKMVVRRERPGLHDGAYVFRAFTDHPFRTTDFGFPSGHTMVAFAGAAAVARLFPRAGPVAYLMAAGCGATRVLAQAHFASDVVGAALAAWAVVAILWHWAVRSPREAGAPGG